MFDLFMSSLNHGMAYIVTDHNGCLSSCFVFQLMLGLVSHEPHFSLLREEVRFGRQAQSQRPTTPEETTFHLLHLSLLREYLAEEFTELRVGHLPCLMVESHCCHQSLLLVGGQQDTTKEQSCTHM